ncbi:MAG: APC family permease [Candidatus Aminicenantaceae bacterium]
MNESKKAAGMNTDNGGLKRQLGLFPTTNIVVANMIGAGIFTTSGLLMGGLKNPFIMLVLWLVGGLIAFCGALSYGVLGAKIPEAGGEYIFLTKLYRPKYGFLSGWVSFFGGFSAPIAASAIGFVEYLVRAFPFLLPASPAESWEASLLKKLFAITVIIIFTFIHSRGLKFGAGMQNILTLLKVFLILGLVGAGLAFGRGSLSHFQQSVPFTFNFQGWKTIGLSLMWIMFSYSGWNAAAYIGSEIKKPQKNLPRSLLLGTGIVIFLYLLLNVYYVYAVPPDQMDGVISIAGLAVGISFGTAFESALSVMISFALFSSLSAFIILAPRVYYAMSRDGLFFPFASKIHPRFQVPSHSIWLQGSIASVMVALGTFDQILTYMGFSLGIFPLMAVWGIFKLRRSGTHPQRIPGYPWAPALYLFAGAVILSLGFLERPVESSTAILTVLAGIPVYLFFRNKYRKDLV